MSDVFVKNFDPGHLAREDTRLLFENEIASAPILLGKIKNPKVLWLNERAIEQDSKFRELGRDREAYEHYLLGACAYATDFQSGHQVIGWADRYGGRGNGTCGGSGRAAFVNGYHVKGVGRTPLLGLRVDAAHSTGSVCLEEAIRETIYAEIMSSFPWSSIPNLAIIDTGLFQKWDASEGWVGPELERRVLIVRPSFIRPAHLERAERPILAEPRAGFKDASRVRHIIETAEKLLYPLSLAEVMLSFWERWAEQMAYGLVNKITHYSSSTANVCINGQLVDFGATRTAIVRSSIRDRKGAALYGEELDNLIQSISRTQEIISRYGPDISFPTNAVDRVMSAYNRQFFDAFCKKCFSSEYTKNMAMSRKYNEIEIRLREPGEFKSTVKRILCGTKYSGVSNVDSNIDCKNEYTFNKSKMPCAGDFAYGALEIFSKSNNVELLEEFSRESLYREIHNTFSNKAICEEFTGVEIGQYINHKVHEFGRRR